MTKHSSLSPKPSTENTFIAQTLSRLIEPKELKNLVDWWPITALFHVRHKAIQSQIDTNNFDFTDL
jgi:hypothetical protein